MYKLFEVSFKSVVEVDYLDPLHLIVSLAFDHLFGNKHFSRLLNNRAFFYSGSIHTTQIFNHITTSFNNLVYT